MVSEAIVIVSTVVTKPSFEFSVHATLDCTCTLKRCIDFCVDPGLEAGSGERRRAGQVRRRHALQEGLPALLASRRQDYVKRRRASRHSGQQRHVPEQGELRRAGALPRRAS